MTARLPFFTIVIPTYGRPGQLRRCLESLSKLEYPPDRFEVVVVDDGSETPLDALVDPYSEHIDVTLVRQQHAGPAAARNTGAARAKGRFLAFTDDDCAPSVDWLRVLARIFMERTDCGIGGRTLNLLTDNLCSAASQMLVGYLYTYYNAAPDQARFFTSNNLGLPADGFRALGGFDTSFIRTAGEDRELCDRWLHRGYKLLYAPEVVVYHAHELNLLTFWRQHFGYGRGAYQFHRARAAHTRGRFRIEPPRFYAGIVRYPFLQSRGAVASTLIAALLTLSQVANAAGFGWEGTRKALTSLQPP